MFTPLGEARPLPFPLLNQVTNENTVNDAGLPVNQFVWPEDSTERTIVPMYLSLDEYVALSSAIDVGADIAYPLQTVEVTWIWMRQMAYSMDLCALIAQCIASSEGTKQAIRDLIANDPSILNTITTISGVGSPVPETTLVSTADDDALFGAITFLVDTMYDAIVDFNGLAELTTNFRERAAILFEAIPVIETAPVDEIPEFIDKIYEDVMEVFEGQWSTTPITGSRDRIRCGLMCLALLNDNTLTWEMIRDYFWEQVSFVPAGPVVGVIGQFVAFLATGNWVGQAVVDISFANFATAMTLGQKFGDLLFPTMETIMQLGLNNPDPDWATLCEGCLPDCTEYDFTVSDHGFTPLLPGYAVYVPGEGWARGTGLDVGRCGLQSAIGAYTLVQFVMNMPADNPTSFVGLLEYPYPPYVQITPYQNATGQASVTVTHTYTGAGLAFDLGTVESGSSSFPIPAEWRLTKIIVCRD